MIKKQQLKKTAGRAAVLALSAALLTQSADAASLGGLISYSFLNEPLSVVVTIEKLDAADIEGLTARVVSAEGYAAAGVKRPSWADKAIVRVKTLGDGRYGVEVRTSEPITDPATSLLLELKAKSGEATREYALLLDIKNDATTKEVLKPETVRSAPISAKEFERKVAEAQAARETAKSAVASVKAARAAQASRAPSASVETDGSVRVRNGSVLSAIAAATAREGVTRDQMMLGYLSQNPSAFVGSNINRLKAGVILRVPTKDEALSVDAARAKAQVAQMGADYAGWRSGAGSASLPAASVEVKKRDASGTVGKVIAAPSQGDELRLGKAKTKEGASKEDLLSKQKELAEANSRAKDLERVADDLKKLLAIKDEQLAKAAALSAAAEKSAEAGKDVKAPLPPLPEKVNGKSMEPPKSVEPAEEKPAEPVKAEEKPVAPAPVVAPAAKKPIKTPIVITQELPPSFMEQNGEKLFLGSALLALMLAALGVQRFKRRRQNALEGSVTITPEPLSTVTRGDDDLAMGPSAFEERIQAADTFMVFNQDEKALGELTEALALEPQHPDALIRVARLAAKAQDKDSFYKAVDELRLGSGYRAHQAELDRLAVELRESEPVAHSMDMSQGLESFVETETPRSVVDEVYGRDAGARAEASAFAPMSEPELLAPMSEFKLPEPEAEPFEVTAPIAPTPLVEEGSSNEMDFHSVSFNLDLPDDKPASHSGMSMEAPALSESSSNAQNFSLDFDAIGAGEAKDEGSSETKTMLDLAKAYSEMGDSEGARELLQEVAKTDNGSLGDEARELLAKMG